MPDQVCRLVHRRDPQNAAEGGSEDLCVMEEREILASICSAHDILHIQCINII